MSTKVVEISLQQHLTKKDDKEIVYKNPYVTVDWGEEIEWKCTPMVPFSILLGWGAPTEFSSYCSKGDPIKIKIPSGAKGGHYRYTVAVYDPDKQKIFVDDPEFIIPRPPGNQGP